MKRVADRRIVVLALIAPLVVACGGVPATHYYVLESPQVALTQARSGLDVGVRLFQVNPPYDQDRIVYRVGQGSPEIGFYAYHRWAVPLERNLPDLVAAALSGVAGVRSIAVARPGQSHEAYLDGRLLSLEEIDDPGSQRVQVRVLLTLRDANDVELWSHELTGEGTTQTREVREIVEEMNRVLSRALDEAGRDLAHALTNGS